MVEESFSDDFLARQARLGDRRAFDALVERYLDNLLRFASLTCGSRAMAEEAVQRGLEAAWRQAPSIPGDVLPKTWLFKVLVETCHSLRAQHGNRDVDEALEVLHAPEAARQAPGPVPSSCEECRAKISEYLDDELGKRDRQALEEHLRACAECSRYDREMWATVQSLHGHVFGGARAAGGGAGRGHRLGGSFQ